jgi:hypothetical protein
MFSAATDLIPCNDVTIVDVSRKRSSIQPHHAVLARGDNRLGARNVAEGRVCHFVALFKHTGEFAGIAPKGNQIRIPVISTFRIADGNLAEAWEIYDSGDMLRQIEA